jgi:hypothetical protein
MFTPVLNTLGKVMLEVKRLVIFTVEQTAQCETIMTTATMWMQSN